MRVTFVLTLHWSCLCIDGFRLYMALLPAIHLHFLSQVSDYLAAYRLLNSRPFTSDLLLSIIMTSFHGHLPKDLHSLSKWTILSLICPLSDFTADCPSGMQLHLYLRKTFASTGFAFSDCLIQSHPFLLAYRLNVSMCTCPHG